jgi:hypothetical protein
MKPLRDEFMHVWRVPLWLGALTAFGLLAALLGTGPWRWAAWVALGAPLATALYFVWRPRE